ncbi:hypothetical protein HYFRA_00012260 [Hymenoscyphus fraxineus]|uniref:Mannan endo-1,6-alpha-mannosidase n=1 Tax=Hymenoscyphus fraxineus TaxID=746836 RepID=A0A9N9L143_9HELO|nr:hypothetical protein HYFRA_00012260 [Hymenoscyphus fraxineus]
MRFLPVVALCALAGQGANAALVADLTTTAGIKTTAKTLATDLLSFYTGNRVGDTPGNLPDPYYWWEAGAVFGTMINYWYYTGDESFNAITLQAMAHQVGDDYDYMPLNQTKTLGNDDQGFWGMSAMMAAEANFPEAPKPVPGWLALAQGVFNTQASRWDDKTCGGGLRWQIFPFNNGYDYKNTISNGCFFNLAARLALYTGNSTYTDWATKTWDWVYNEGLVEPGTYKVFDGTNIRDNCTSKDHNQWTYNAGIYLLGAASMYNMTTGNVQAQWQERVSGLLNQTVATFFANGAPMRELCESTQPGVASKCNTDQRSFKGYLARWMAATSRLAPFTQPTIAPLLANSAAAVVKTCSGGNSGTQCGLRWDTGAFDGSNGVGEQMAALEVVQGNLVGQAKDWASRVKGTGNSTENNDAGATSQTAATLLNKPITTKDRVGAGFLTALVMIGVVGGSATLMISE